MAQIGYHGIFSARPAPDRRHNRGLRRKLLFCAPHRQDVGGGDPRLIVLFIILLPFMVIWETAKKS